MRRVVVPPAASHPAAGPATAEAGEPSRHLAGACCGVGAMVLVGGSVAVSSVIDRATLFTAQAGRYLLACLILLGVARLRGRPVLRPRGGEWLWLLGVTVSGLVVFNLALVNGARHAEPAVLGVAVACVPLLLAIVGPLLDGHRPHRSVLLAALVVTAGATLVQGTGRSDAVGLVWAATVLVCEAGFTLLAVPVLRRLGPWGVSVHTTWLAAVLFGGLGLVHEGPTAVRHLRAGELGAVGYLAVGVTAVAFVLWYSAVGHLGPGRAGLLTGVAPLAAAAVGVLLGRPTPAPTVWLGVSVVAAGLTLGLVRRRPAVPAPRRAG